jgi:hypothetical protein
MSDKTTEEMVADAIKDRGGESVPGGYIEVKLSSKGKLGAPAVFRCRNFGTEELVELSLSDPTERPIKVCECLQKMIWEKNVDVRDFHEKEVIELLVLIYYTFYGPTFKDVDYEPDDADWKFLESQSGGPDSEEFIRLKSQYANGQWKPKFDVNLDDVNYFELPDDFKKVAFVKKQSGFTCKYSYPKYGDLTTMRDVTNRIWATEDNKYRSIGEIIKFRRDSEDRIRRGEQINYRSIPNVTQADVDEYYDYERRKARFIVQAVRGLHLVEYKGKDVSKEPIEKRIEYAKDPEIDGVTFEQIQKHFDEIKVGIDPMIKVRSPIQQKVITRRFPFRVDTVLQSLRDSKPVGVTISFVDEDV